MEQMQKRKLDVLEGVNNSDNCDNMTKKSYDRNCIQCISSYDAENEAEEICSFQFTKSQ
jgi:hypothetical protein